jgi:hypothetical protein
MRRQYGMGVIRAAEGLASLARLSEKAAFMIMDTSTKRNRYISLFGALIAPTLVCALFAQAAQAFVDPPVLVPAHPFAGQVVSIALAGGGCDAYTSDPATVTRIVNQIYVIVPAVHSFDTDYCVYGSGTYTLPIGAFESGVYVMQVDRSYLGRDGYVTEPLGTIAFEISTVAQAPAMTAPGRLFLVFCLLVVVGSVNGSCARRSVRLTRG